MPELAAYIKHLRTKIDSLEKELRLHEAAIVREQLSAAEKVKRGINEMIKARPQQRLFKEAGR